MEIITTLCLLLNVADLLKAMPLAHNQAEEIPLPNETATGIIETVNRGAPTIMHACTCFSDPSVYNGAIQYCPHSLYAA